MRDLAGQDSNQALSASYYEHGAQGRKQPHQQQFKKAIGTSPSSDNGAVQSDPELPTAVASPTGHHTRQSTNQHPSQPSKTDSSGTKKAKTVEEEEEDEILQKLGVLSAGSSASRSGGTRSGLTHASGRSRRKGHWTSDSEEEGRAKANAKRRRGPVEVSKDEIEEPFSIRLMIDSKANYLPIRLNRLDLTMVLESSTTKIADNDNLLSSFVIQPRVAEVVDIPMRLQYRAMKKNDMILDDLIEACTPIQQLLRARLPRRQASQPLGFDIIVVGKLDVWGLSWVWKPEFSFSAQDVPCPINAASNQPSGGGGNVLPSPSSGVVTVPPATAFVQGITVSAPTATLDASLPIATHVNMVAEKTTSAASLPSSTPTF
ncbi:hypothetical protein EC991_005993 [Linnemannia zychae]|nr:hypothetical protein EC991_005993 [Linnemannia zychae]